jgi:hypothetical protein
VPHACGLAFCADNYAEDLAKPVNNKKDVAQASWTVVGFSCDHHLHCFESGYQVSILVVY